MATSGTASALTAASIGSGHTIYLGDTAGTAISTQGATGVTTFNGVMTDLSGKTGGWAKQGAGTLQVGGVSTYSGPTAINNGTVQLTTGNDRLPTNTVISIGQSASTNLGTLDLNGQNQQIAGLVSSAGTNAGASKNTVKSASAATLTINTGGSNSYSYGDSTTTNSGVITGAINLVKSGTGTQTLGGANTYTGTTAITGGTLSVTGSLASPTTTISSGATLTGNGTLTGAITTLANTAAITPGVSGLGTLSLASLNAASGVTVNSALGTTSALLAISGSLNGSANAGDFKFNFTDAGGLITGHAYTVLTFGSQSGLDYSDLAVASLPPSFTLDTSFGTDGWNISDGGLQVQFIPEPHAVGLAGVGMLLLLQRRRRHS
jgi:autotransporter-associated beta strand protein